MYLQFSRGNQLVIKVIVSFCPSIGYLLSSAALLPLFRRRTLLVCSALGMAASNAAAAALAAEGAAVLGARASAAATALALCLFVLVRSNHLRTFDLNL